MPFHLFLSPLSGFIPFATGSPSTHGHLFSFLSHPFQSLSGQPVPFFSRLYSFVFYFPLQVKPGMTALILALLFSVLPVLSCVCVPNGMLGIWLEWEPKKRDREKGLWLLPHPHFVISLPENAVHSLNASMEAGMPPVYVPPGVRVSFHPFLPFNPLILPFCPSEEEKKAVEPLIPLVLLLLDYCVVAITWLLTFLLLFSIWTSDSIFLVSPPFPIKTRVQWLAFHFLLLHLLFFKESFCLQQTDQFSTVKGVNLDKSDDDIYRRVNTSSISMVQMKWFEELDVFWPKNQSKYDLHRNFQFLENYWKPLLWCYESPAKIKSTTREEEADACQQLSWKPQRFLLLRDRDINNSRINNDDDEENLPQVNNKPRE